jgi:hypothetical protein
MLPVQLRQYDKRVVGFSLLFYFLVGTELSIVHHMGHSIVCASEGYRFNISLNPVGGYSTCYGNPENLLVYSILGPAFGTMAAGVPLAVPKIRRSRVWRIVLLALLANEAVKIPIEAIVQMPSEIPALHIAMLVFQYGLLASLIATFAKKKENVLTSWETSP